MPPQFRGGEPKPSQISLADEKWFDLFQDNVLRHLINEALQANYDILIAAQRVVAAEGQMGDAVGTLPAFGTVKAQRHESA